MPKLTSQFTERSISALKPKISEYTRCNNGLRIRIYPNGRKSWFLYKTAPNGKRDSITLGEYPQVSVKMARDAADRLRAEQLRKGFDIADHERGITFGEYIHSSSYIEWSLANRKAHNSIMSNLYSDIIPSWFKKTPLKLFSKKEFERFINDRLKKGIKRSTINRNLNNIRSVFRHAFENDVIQINPIHTLSRLKEIDSIQKLSLTDDERNRLVKFARAKSKLEFSKTYLELFIEIGLSTGLRKGEIHNLKWSNIKCDYLKTLNINLKDFFKDIEIPNHEGKFKNIDISVQYVDYDIEKVEIDLKNPSKQLKLIPKNPKQHQWYIEIGGEITKSSKSRLVPIPNYLVDKIKSYLWNREIPSLLKKYPDIIAHDHNLNLIMTSSPSVFGYFDEIRIIPFDDIKKSFKGICLNAGLPDVTIHTLRHDFCTMLIKEKHDIETVQRLAGHKDIRTTMKYVHSLRNKDFSNLSSLNKDLFK